jgi:transposase
MGPEGSLSGVALKAGVNTNQLHNVVRTREQGSPPVRHDVPVALSAFAPVVAVDEPAYCRPLKQPFFNS